MLIGGPPRRSRRGQRGWIGTTPGRGGRPRAGRGAGRAGRGPPRGTSVRRRRGSAVSAARTAAPGGGDPRGLPGLRPFAGRGHQQHGHLDERVPGGRIAVVEGADDLPVVLAGEPGAHAAVGQLDRFASVPSTPSAASPGGRRGSGRRHRCSEGRRARAGPAPPSTPRRSRKPSLGRSHPPSTQATRPRRRGGGRRATGRRCRPRTARRRPGSAGRATARGPPGRRRPCRCRSRSTVPRTAVPAQVDGDAAMTGRGEAAGDAVPEPGVGREAVDEQEGMPVPAMARELRSPRAAARLRRRPRVARAEPAGSGRSSRCWSRWRD